MASEVKSTSQEIVIPTVEASHCGGACLLRVHVKDGVITRIETDDAAEPQHRACWRGRAYRQRVYSPDRVLYPLKRVGNRGEGKFERISWDEALNTVANEIKRCQVTYGPASILFAHMAGDSTLIHGGKVCMDRLLAMAGGYTDSYGIASFGQGMFSSTVTYGTVAASNSRDDLLNSRLIILWGFDPAKCINGTNTAWYLAQAREHGARIVSIDPNFGDTTATLADEWIPIRPATDAAMLIAMAYVMIKENLQDQAFIDKFTFGFDKYRDYLMGVGDGVPKTPQWAEKITGVPAATIERLAREYATMKPAALLAGIGPGRTASGEMYHRAAVVLAAMTGNVGIHGGDAAARAWESLLGGLPYKLGQMMKRSRNPVEEGLPTIKGVIPISSSANVQFGKMADAILKGKAGGYPADYKMMVVFNCNYLNAMPDINKIVRALHKLEFVMVMEQFMTPTARFADVILPVCTYMERNDITLGHQTPFYGCQNKIIEPLGESRSQLDICSELARKLDITDYNDKTDVELQRQMILASEVPDYEQFKKDAIFRMKPDEPYVAFKRQIEDIEHYPFRTPSGKIEIYSKVMAEWNDPKLPPIPEWIEPFETLSDPLAGKYPLQLITPHGKRRALGQFDTLPWLRESMPQFVCVNDADARVRGIRDGDMVRVYNDRGVVLLPVKVTQRIMPGVVLIESGAWYNPDKEGVDRGGNTNVLLSDEPSAGGHFAYNSCLVEVRKDTKS